MYRPILAAAVLAAFLTGSPARAEVGCEALLDEDFDLPGLDLELTAAKREAAATTAEGGALPAHCMLEGVIDRRVGTADVEYGIRFALALPDDWNGRFLFQGGGGLNGVVRPPVGAGAAGGRSALERGFAVVSTDSGHEGAVFDGSFFADQEATLNFLYRAIGKVAVTAERLIGERYGRPAEHSYYVGCSTGGREAMIMSQRYPTYFDGIVAGAPAMRTGYSNLGMRWVSVALGAAADRDADGNPIPFTALSEADKTLFNDALLAQCDAADGIEDGMIFDPLGCDFDPVSLTCDGAEASQCLSASQAEAIRTAMRGPSGASGYPVYTGYLYDTGLTTTAEGVIPGLLNGAPSPVGGPNPPTTQDVNAEALEAARAPSALGDTHLWTNLNTFSGNGGKLLFYHGVSDPWFSALDTVEYYERLVDEYGDRAAVEAWSKLYLVPGMGHCSGGEAALDRFDLLTPLVDWVENGAAPDAVVATGAALPGRSRPLCPYPAHAHYTGQGDPEDVASYECRE